MPPMIDKTILIVDDDEDILTAGKLLLKRHFDQVEICSDPTRIPELLRAQHFAAILLDMNFGPGESSGQQGFYWLGEILNHDPDAVVVLITAHGGVDIAVEAMKLGATDFIAKPWQNEKVVATLSSAVKLRASRTEASRLKQTNSALIDAAKDGQAMLGSSPVMQQVHQTIQLAAPTDANVLLLGENGTGKELAARAIHQASNRANEIFMAVDLGAITESLFESELFGHIKGAFTDAKTDKLGRFPAAQRGTLFLDEIGNLPLHLQAKLLSVLEQRQVLPVGATKAIPIDVRIIAATNMPRAQLEDENVFRQDLLFRLNTVEITLPPLRDREGDILTLAEHYAALYARKYQQAPRGFSAEARDAMTSYHWPGNVRALRHTIERAVILSKEEELGLSDLSITAATQTPKLEPEDPALDDLNLERIEKTAIQKCLTKHRYNISHAAKELGITRAALYRRMERHGL